MNNNGKSNGNYLKAVSRLGVTTTASVTCTWGLCHFTRVSSFNAEVMWNVFAPFCLSSSSLTPVRFPFHHLRWSIRAPSPQHFVLVLTTSNHLPKCFLSCLRAVIKSWLICCPQQRWCDTVRKECKWQRPPSQLEDSYWHVINHSWARDKNIIEWGFIEINTVGSGTKH